MLDLSREGVKKVLKQILKDSLELKIPLEEIEGNDLVNELGINSVDSLEILVWVENHFKIQIPDEDLKIDLIKSLDNLASYIINHKEDKNDNQ